MLACEYGKLDIVLYFRKYLSPIDMICTKYKPMPDALWIACHKGHTNIVRYLLDLMLPDTFDDFGSSLINTACENNNTDMLRLIITNPYFKQCQRRSAQTFLKKRKTHEFFFQK